MSKSSDILNSYAKTSSKGSTISKNLSLYFAFTNRAAFTEFFIAKAWSRKGLKVRYFHLPPMLSDDAVLLGGRSHGKSFAVLEPRIVQSMFIYPDEESVLSAYRKLHIKDRVENVVMILNKVPYFKAFIMNIRRDPHYDILLRNGHRFFGISVGDDPTAISIQGKHPKVKFGEEWQVFPLHAWKQWQSTTHPSGCKELYCGVVDGRVDTPFKMLDTPGTTTEIDKFANKRFHIPRHFDPWWNEETKRDCIRNFGSENADEYLQQVRAQWGSPASSVWDTLAIFACMNKNNDCMRLDFDQNTIDEFTELSLPDAPKQSGPTRIAFGIDTGYTEPTEMAGFAYVGNKWKLFLILSMRNKIIYETQTEVINRVLSFYNASFAGVDSTSYPIISNMLKNPSGRFKDKEYGDRIVDVMFNENISYMMSGEERKQKTKSFSTDYLRSMFKKGQFDLPLDDELINNFNSEKLLTVKTGKIICTPERVHITDSFRCFVVAYFKLYTEDFTGENINRDDALPEMGHSGIFGNTWGQPQFIYSMLTMRRN